MPNRRREYPASRRRFLVSFTPQSGYGAPTTATGSSRIALVPSPSWPLVLVPQHQTLPASVRAQVCRPATPVLMLLKAWSPATRMGELEPRPLFPFAPHWLEPQQNATSA